MLKPLNGMLPGEINPHYNKGDIADVTDKMRRGLRRAVKQWNTREATLIRVVSDTTDLAGDVYIRWLKPGVKLGKTDQGRVILGQVEYVDDFSPIIAISHEAIERHRHVPVIAHEIGHVLGLDHEDQWPSVMRSKIGDNDPMFVTQRDRHNAIEAMLTDE